MTHLLVWHDLAHHSIGDLEKAGLQLRLDTRAEAIDPADRTVWVTGPGRQVEQLSYDKLIIGTGALPVRPSPTLGPSPTNPPRRKP